MSADDDALLARRVDKIVAITDPETVEPTQAASVTCRVCGAVNPQTVYDHDGAAHDHAAVMDYDREQAKREGPRSGSAKASEQGEPDV